VLEIYGISIVSCPSKNSSKLNGNNMKAVAYIKESYNELVNKVSWPTRKELTNSALVVMVASFIIALLVFVVDFSFEKLMGMLYGLFF